MAIIAKQICSDNQNSSDKCLRRGCVKIENTFGILKNKWTILKNLNVDVKHVDLVTIACCVLYNFYHMNHDIHHIGVVGMQDPHPNLNVSRGIPTRITSNCILSQNRQRIRNTLFKYLQENEKNKK